MLRHYIRIAFRNLSKNKTSTFIHLTGLSLSVAFCLLLYGYIRHEQSFDGFHAKGDRLFRLEMTDAWGKAFGPRSGKTDENKYTLIFPLVAGIDMSASLPDIESVTRFKDNGDGLVKVNNQVYREKHRLYVDSNFFQNFSFRLVKGSPATALGSTNNVVLSESVAKKYFGSKDPIGQIVSLLNDSVQLFTVSGVAEDAPPNSSIQYDLIVRNESDLSYAEDMKERFNHMTHLTAVVLKPRADRGRFEAKMNQWVKGYFVQSFVKDYGIKEFDAATYNWHLRPLTDCHYNPSEPWGHYTSLRNIYLLGCLALVILLIAALNYVLLSVANVAARAQEAGVRKVMGAGKGSILVQFWLETQLLVIGAVGIGLLLAGVLMPVFNSLLDTQVSWAAIPALNILTAVATLCLLLGLLAGYYPALLMARMRAVSVLKGGGTFKINPRLSRVLVVLQFTSCIVLMMAAFIINRQMHYISNKDLGFDREQVLIVKTPVWDDKFTGMLQRRLYHFAGTRPEVTVFSGMNGGLDGSYNMNGFKLNGERQYLSQLTVDYNYFQLMGLKLVQGRFFSPDFPTDTARATRGCVVNETLFNLLGKEAKLGRYDSTIRAVIVGVCKDYHIESLTKKITPVQHVLPGNGTVSNFLFRVRPGGMPLALAALKKEWKTITDYPLEYTFLDQQVAGMYESEARWQGIIQDSCVFALFIACLGLFGLSAINAANRVREIGIRKVLGATVTNIAGSLSSQFVVLVLLSLVIAIPISGWLMSRWLEDFAYRIEIRWWMFVAIGAAAMLTALVTVSFQSIRAAMANPIDSLRTE